MWPENPCLRPPTECHPPPLLGRDGQLLHRSADPLHSHCLALPECSHSTPLPPLCLPLPPMPSMPRPPTETPSIPSPQQGRATCSKTRSLSQPPLLPLDHPLLSPDHASPLSRGGQLLHADLLVQRTLFLHISQSRSDSGLVVCHCSGRRFEALLRCSLRGRRGSGGARNLSGPPVAPPPLLSRGFGWRPVAPPPLIGRDGGLLDRPAA